MHNHLVTAHDNLTPYAACIPTFDFGAFGRVPQGSMINGEPHTHIVGIVTQLLWSIALSDCCCTCVATDGGGGGGAGNASGCFVSEPGFAASNRNDRSKWAQPQSPAAPE